MSFLKKMLGYPEEEKKTKDIYEKVDEDAREGMEFLKLVSAAQAQELADKVMAGKPLVVNFEDVDVSEANQVIAFLSGIVYVINGVNLQMQKKVFLFSNSENLEDGSIMDFYNQYKEVE
jgi:cell division inhibitor SepF